MAITLNTKVALRRDTLTNWNKHGSQVLKSGELAIVIDDLGNERLKIGNGLSAFSDLPYVYESQLKTDNLIAKDVNANSIAQGLNVKATPTSLATGVYTKADGNFNVVHGIEAIAKEGDDYAFVYNGQNLPGLGTDFYESHGEGTFNVNTVGGLSGVYFGDKSLFEILSGFAYTQELSDYYKKSETSSSIELSSALVGKQDQKTTFNVTVASGEKFGLQLYSYQNKSNNNTIIHWGDGSTSYFREASHYIEKVDSITGKQEGYYEIKITKDDYESGSFDVTVIGSDYFMIRPLRGQFNSNTYVNCVSEIFGGKYNFAPCVKNVSSFGSNSKISTISVMYEEFPKTIDNCTSLFNQCQHLTSVKWDESWAAVPRFSCACMFNECPNLSAIEGYRLPSQIDSTEYGSFAQVFAGCRNLSVDINDILPVGGFSNKKIDLYCLFYNCNKLYGNVPSWMLWEDASKIFENTNMAFGGCSEDIRLQVPYGWGGLKDIPGVYVTLTTTQPNQKVAFKSISTGPYTHIRWGDGSEESVFDSNKEYSTNRQDPEIAHAYVQSGEYTIIVYGGVETLSFAKSGSSVQESTLMSDLITRVITRFDAQLPVQIIGSMFMGCPNIIEQSIGSTYGSLRYSGVGNTSLRRIRLPNLTTLTNVFLSREFEQSPNLEEICLNSLTIHSVKNSAEFPFGVRKECIFVCKDGYLRNNGTDWIEQPIIDNTISYPIERYVDGRLNGRLLSSDLNFSYDSNTKYISLKAFNNDIGKVDCSDFIKDGMLSTAYLSGNTLVLIFNTDAGKTPISVNLSSFVDNYSEQIKELSNDVKVLSSAISTIGEDYLDSNDKLEIYNDLLSPDEVRLYKGPGQKDITLSVATGTQLCTYTATLSDFYLASETSSSSEISSAIRDFVDPFKSITFIKPYSEHPLYISVDVSENMDFSQNLTIDSSVSPQFFNGFHDGTWNEQPLSGFGIVFNDRPVEMTFRNYLNSIGLHTQPSSSFYIRYSWYWNDENVQKHYSDSYSLIVPTNTEVGANSRDVVSKREFLTLDSQVNIQTRHVSESTEYSKHWMVDNESFNEIQQVLSSGNTICLQNYGENKHYNVKFTTSTENDVILNIAIDNGNGPESSTFTIEQRTFKPNSTYVVDIFHNEVIVKTIDGKDFVKYSDSKVINLFKRVQMIKPYSENLMFCELTASLSSDFSNPLSVDSSISNTLFSGFSLNNIDSEWTIQPLSGFTVEFNNQPVSFDLETLLTSNSIYPTDEDLVYVKYKWYWIDENNIRHRSDTYSSILPTNTEVGANSHDVISKREFRKLENIVIPSSQDIGLDEEYGMYYSVNRYTFSNITCDVQNGDMILLNDFNRNGNYRIRFNTIQADSNISVSFYVDYGNGPELDDTLAINNNSFMPNTDYTIEVKYDSIVIDSINRRDIVSYLKENSNSVTLRVWNG